MNAIERIKLHNPTIRKDADIRVMTGYAVPHELKVSGERRELLVTANTARIDQDNEVVVSEGGRLGYFGENRSVFYDHLYDDSNFIGKVRTGYPKLDNGVWKVLFGIRRSERGDQLVRDAEDFDVSVSIGFDAIDRGEPTDDEVKRYGGGKRFRSIVRLWEWVELSVTWMPCNPDARSRPVVQIPPKSWKRGTLTPYGFVTAH